MTHSFPFEQFQCDTRRPRQGEPRHGCLAVTGKKADETPGTKEMRQGLWGARAVTCIVCRRRVSPSRVPRARHPHHRRRRHRREFLAGSVSLRLLFAARVSATVSASVPLQPPASLLRVSLLALQREGGRGGEGGTIAVGGVRVHRAASRRA